MMKNRLSFTVLVMFAARLSTLHGQSVIWSEDFDCPDGTMQGSGTPPCWYVDTTACNMAAAGDWFEVRSGQMEGRDLDGEAVWFSEKIDISGYSDIGISADISESGTLEGADYIRLFFRIDSGPEILFETNGDNSDDFDSLNANQKNLNGNLLEIVVRVQNNAGTEYIRFDHIRVSGEKKVIDQPPGISRIPDQTTPEDTDTQWISFTIDDDFTAPSALSVFGCAEDKTLIPDSHVYFDGSGSSRKILLEPAPDRFGTTRVTVYVSDGPNRSSTDFQIFVQPVNDPPFFSHSLPGISLYPGEISGLAYSLWWSFVTDVDNTTADLNWHVCNGKVVNIESRTDSVFIEAPADWTGTDTLRVIVQDPELADSTELVVHVLALGDTTAPPPPRHVTARFSENGIHVHWSLCHSPDIHMYRIHRSTDSTLTVSQNIIGSVLHPDSAFVDTTAAENIPYYYRISSSDYAGNESDLSPCAACIRKTESMGCNEIIQPLPGLRLAQNYPNPFNPGTVIEYHLPEPSHVLLEVFDIQGRKVTELVNSYQNTGFHEVSFSVHAIPAGTYFYRIRTDASVQWKKMLVIR